MGLNEWSDLDLEGMVFRIALDFDGTLADHEYPRIGKTAPGAVEWVKKWKAAGALIILWTMRSGDFLVDAVNWCHDRDIKLDSINAGIGDRSWTDSDKAYANVYVDDAAFGCPLIENNKTGGRPMVDWSIVGPGVLKMIQEHEARRVSNGS